MNKTWIVAAISALAAGGALAQSSVTLYGRVNTSGERWDKNGVKTYQLVNSSSRWGVKGVEDLGGSMKAGFQLESGFNSDTGAVTASTFFGRQAEVNLAGTFGMVRLGQMISEAYFATADYVSMHNHDTGTSSDKLYAYVGRNSNKVSYRLPEFVKGLSIEGGVSAGEGAANTKRSYDFAANYALDKVQFGLGAEKNDQSKQIAARVATQFGAFTVGGYVQRDTNGFGPSTLVNSYGTRTNYRLSGMYALGNNEFHLNFGHAGKYSKVANSSAKQYTVAYNYNLSKRTKVYAFYTKLDDGRANIYNAANYGIATTGRTTDFSSLAFGLRHNF